MVAIHLVLLKFGGSRIGLMWTFSRGAITTTRLPKRNLITVIARASTAFLLLFKREET